MRELAIGLVPLLIYVLVETIASRIYGEQRGLTIGLISAVALGVIQFLVLWRWRGFPDRLILLDTSLLVVFGAVSLFLTDPLFFKLKPAVLEGLIVILLLGFSFAPAPVFSKVLGRYLPGVTLTPPLLRSMRRMVRWTVLVIALHILAVIATALWAGQELWAFTSSILLYLMMGLVALAPLARRRLADLRLRRRYRDDVWLPLVDTSGREIGKAPRAIVHQDPQLLHPALRVLVLGKRNSLLLERRSPEQESPAAEASAVWDTPVQGHQRLGESREEALLRLIREELGLDRLVHEFCLAYLWFDGTQRELIHLVRAYAPRDGLRLAGEDRRFVSRRELRKRLLPQLSTQLRQELELLARQEATAGSRRRGSAESGERAPGRSAENPAAGTSRAAAKARAGSAPGERRDVEGGAAPQ
jgi:intracellular septation protein A/8-oxo-dGTP pyrophosphatase MutT (NUDIX family)